MESITTHFNSNTVNRNFFTGLQMFTGRHAITSFCRKTLISKTEAGPNVGERMPEIVAEEPGEGEEQDQEVEEDSFEEDDYEAIED
jgi:hypothetical protein